MEAAKDSFGNSSSRRLAVLQGHLNSKSTNVQPSHCSGGKPAQTSAPMSSTKDEVQKAFPMQRYDNSVYLCTIVYISIILLSDVVRQNVLKWNGWGYKDSGFILNERGHGQFLGKRYVTNPCR